MTKLSDTQCLLLSAAAQREGNIALPLPPSLRGGAAKKVVGALLAKGYLAEAPASREPGTLVWDHDDEDNPITLVATAHGPNVIGIEPEGTDAPDAPDMATEGATDAQDAGAATEAPARTRVRPRATRWRTAGTARNAKSGRAPSRRS